MVFWGSDYSSLETHVGAIITHDEALRKILLDGYDSHSLYTAVYFEDELKEIYDRAFCGTEECYIIFNHCYYLRLVKLITITHELHHLLPVSCPDFIDRLHQ